MGRPSIWTVQAPHCAMPQPNFVPRSLSSSRSTHSKGVSASLVALTTSPFNKKSTMVHPLLAFLLRLPIISFVSEGCSFAKKKTRKLRASFGF
jgi:hypothetical protein